MIPNLARLKERERNIEQVQELTEKFSNVTRNLADWLGDFSNKLDGLPRVSTQPDKQKLQREEMQVRNSAVQEVFDSTTVYATSENQGRQRFKVNVFINSGFLRSLEKSVKV